MEFQGVLKKEEHVEIAGSIKELFNLSGTSWGSSFKRKNGIFPS